MLSLNNKIGFDILNLSEFDIYDLFNFFSPRHAINNNIFDLFNLDKTTSIYCGSLNRYSYLWRRSLLGGGNPSMEKFVAWQEESFIFISFLFSLKSPTQLFLSYILCYYMLSIYQTFWSALLFLLSLNIKHESIHNKDTPTTHVQYSKITIR